MRYLIALIFLASAAWLALQPGMWPGALVIAGITVLMLARSQRRGPRRKRQQGARRPRRGAIITPRHEREGGND